MAKKPKPITDALNNLSTPHQLRRMSHEQLEQLAEAIRQRVIDVVAARGGHLASNLGVAELTIALHYVYDFAQDRLLWDVGHQCYPHKLITGRNAAFSELRQAGGLSGFPAPSESEYDLFATGHAGTAISTATGLAWADKRAGRPSRTVAVVGDASLVNGLSFEGLNYAAMLDRQFLIVLNDNSMAIDRTQGALAHGLDRVRLTSTYSELKRSTERLLAHLPMGTEIKDALAHLKAGLQTTLHGGQILEMLGFKYFGPVDGHNIRELTGVLQRLKDLKRPAILHVHTEKGRGCAYAVDDPCRFHSPSAYTVKNGRAVFAEKPRPTWTSTFAEALIEQARKDERVVAITAAMPDGTGLAKFREVFPDRTIDVGISESHAVAMAAGLAKSGLKPVVAIYSTFMQRAFDQVFHELALQNLPVVLCMDRAGLVGSDGAVHHGTMDIACLRPIPGMTLMAPAEGPEMGSAMELALSLPGPSAIRYPRDLIPAPWADPCPPMQLGRAVTVAEGQDGTFLCYGVMVEPALRAARILQREQGLAVQVVNARFAKPLDAACISQLITAGKPVLVCEDHATIGGFGSAIMELAASRGLNATNVRLMGLPDRFVRQATRDEQLTEVGLDATSLADAMHRAIRHPACELSRKYM